MPWRVNIDKDIYKDDDTSPFITYADDGIQTIHWHASDGTLWDMTIDATGAVVTTQVVVAGGSFIPAWFTLIPQ